MRFQSRGELDETTLTRLETLAGFRLPADYRSFLKRTGGGSFVGGYPEIVVDTIGNVLCHTFFGMGLPRALNLEFWHNEMKGEIPCKSLLIGKDPGGGFLLLCCDPELSGLSGVYYYDHSYSFPSSSDEENTYFISESFGELAKLLRIDPQ